MEPFSLALGIISVCTTTASILSFLANTVDSLGEKRREWDECKTRLAAYRCHIDTCRLRLEAWKSLWFDNMRHKTDYTHFWGSEGFLGVQERIEIIEAQCRAIQGYLPSVKNPSAPVANPSSFTKAAFALVNSSGLKDRITRLKEMLGDLEDYSNTKFSKLHDSLSEDLSSDNSLNKLLQLKEGRDRFSHWMNRLHQEQLSRADSWSLVLQIPVGREIVAPDEADMDIDFLVEQQLMDDHWTAHLTKLIYSKDVVESKSLMGLIPMQAGLASSTIKVSRQPFATPPHTQALRKSMEKERSRTALGLATWTFPLVQTSWTADLCSCIIHLAVCEDSTISILDSGGSQRCSTHRPNEDIQSHTFLHLGTTLAELVLAQQIGVLIKTSQEEKVEIVFRTGDEQLDEKSLLFKIKRQKSLAYMQAVKYCFELDREMFGDAFLAQDADRFLTRVIEPLRQYFKRIELHSTTSRQQSWYHKHVPGWDSSGNKGPSGARQQNHGNIGSRNDQTITMHDGQGSVGDTASFPKRLRHECRKLNAD